MIKRINHGLKIFLMVCKIIYIRNREIKWAHEQIKKLEVTFDGKLSNSTITRNLSGYCNAIPLLINPFTHLNGRYSNKGEKERIFLYLLCTAIFDDFFDNKKLSSNDLYRISFQSTHYTPKSFEERLFLYAHIGLRNYVKDKILYDTVTKELFDLQFETSKQLDPLISEEELKRITIEKGGVSALLILFFLDMDTSLINQTCWRQFGFILQMMDDLLDIYLDLQEGVQTLPIFIKDANELDTYFSGLMQDLKQTISNLPNSNKQKEQLIIAWVSVCSICKLALKQLIEIQGVKNELPNLKDLPRNKLIVDMQKSRNLLFCIKFTYRETYKWLY